MSHQKHEADHQHLMAKHDSVEARAEATLKQFVANARALTVAELPAALDHLEANASNIAKGIAHGPKK